MMVSMIAGPSVGQLTPPRQGIRAPCSGMKLGTVLLLSEGAQEYMVMVIHLCSFWFCLASLLVISGSSP